jgi:isocitrate lyase (EC 4.1.3.1)
MSTYDEEAFMYRSQSIPELERSWANDLRWRGIVRPYSAADVDRLRGTIQIDYPVARMGAERSGTSSTPRRSSGPSAR